MKEYRHAWIEVDKTQALHNLGTVRRAVGDTKICAVLKSDGYGLGAIELAKLYHDQVYMFAVAVLQEALILRKIVPDKDILVLGHVPTEGHGYAVESGISLTMYDESLANTLAATAGRLGTNAKVHIKVETGMNRLGFAPSPQNARIIARLANTPELDVQGIFTHFATADEKDKEPTHRQARLFIDFLEQLSGLGVHLPLRHAANSPAVVNFPEYYFDMVRPGLILTGFHTSHYVNEARVPVKPCITLKARLVHIARVAAGEGVGYGYTFRTSRETLIGTLPLGFSDGYLRALSNRGQVLCKGKLCPIIGNICSDQMMIDVTDVPSPAVGDLVVLYGDGTDSAPTAEDASLPAGTIVDEMMTRLAGRLPRIYVD